MPLTDERFSNRVGRFDCCGLLRKPFQFRMLVEGVSLEESKSGNRMKIVVRGSDFRALVEEWGF